jgi:hypothetical protein
MTSSASFPDASPERRLAIVTPSMIGSAQRAAFARASLAELQKYQGIAFAHIVVDDPPKHRGRLFGVVPAMLTMRIASFALRGAANDIYASTPNVRLIQGGGGNSIDAVRRALGEVRALGSGYVFIHLDDNAYVPILASLLRHCIAAMDALPDLDLVRLSAYPIISGRNDRVRGNMALCERVEDTVRFDSVILRPVRLEGFTVWKAAWDASTADGHFWPIMLWNAVYRVGFLEDILARAAAQRLRNLGEVEAWYKSNWRQIQPVQGSFGFINMQFAGLERERNANWQELVSLPNRAVL